MEFFNQVGNTYLLNILVVGTQRPENYKRAVRPLMAIAFKTFIFFNPFMSCFPSYIVHIVYMIYNSYFHLRIIIIIGRYEMQSRTNVHFLVFHLTLADAIVCFITMPMETIWRVVIEVFALQNQRKQEVLLSK